MGQGSGAKAEPSAPKDDDAPSDRPSALRRVYSKARGRDPETGLPRPKGASVKAPGGGSGPRFRDIPDRPERLVGQASEDEPLFRGLGLSDQGPEDDDDPAVATIKRGLTRAKPKAAAQAKASTPPGRGERDRTADWNRNGSVPWWSGPEADGPPTQSGASGGRKQQGRLSRFFKGRRDDGI